MLCSCPEAIGELGRSQWWAQKCAKAGKGWHPNRVRLEAKSWTCCRTTPMPRSSDAFSSRTILPNDLPYSCRATCTLTAPNLDGLLEFSSTNQMEIWKYQSDGTNASRDHCVIVSGVVPSRGSQSRVVTQINVIFLSRWHNAPTPACTIAYC